ncbi:Fic family protein [Pedobacter frigoris]|uniref:Fic family protein n=1 Tax=Pedobacter frigoris TaxID=2571272 RepID=A0A4U1CL22_9SPHI|nr:Fic family protein [Pedobacter frigoris]TKC06971.1 Fic family protein [Pedobacter frigoris]
MEPIQKASELADTLASLRPLDKEQEAIIMQKFRLDWNYNSNNLEGNSLTFGETKALILFGITAQGKPLKDHFEITGHDEAIKWVTELVSGDQDLTEYFIRQLHQLLLKESYEVKAITPDGQPTKRRINVGQYKTAPNHVQTKTGEIFRFATPEETPAKMHDLIEWYRTKSEEPNVNAIILAAEFHYRFIRIHPFDDGNGRTARILMNFILMKFGYPPVITKTDDKENYFGALRQADASIIQPFIDYIAVNLIRSLEIMIAGAKGESIEEPDDVDKEIALLEQRLKTHGEKLEVTKTKTTLVEISKTSIEPLWNGFLATCAKFDKFYLSSRLYVETDGFTWTNKDLFPPLSAVFTDNTSYINFLYAYEELNRPSLREFNYQCVINIYFDLTKGYKLEFGNESITKGYNTQLTVGEIEYISRALAKAHTAFIDEKLK